MTDLMIDLETLGTVADAVIVSIGAVRFDRDTGALGDTFYAEASVDSNLALGRRIQGDTLAWWSLQGDAARSVIACPGLPLAEALQGLSNFVGQGDKPQRVWANGPSFDIAMLEHAYKQCGAHAPWNFWSARCMRTVGDLPAAALIERPKPVVAHNALDDAVAQARYVCLVWQASFLGAACSASSI